MTANHEVYLKWALRTGHDPDDGSLWEAWQAAIRHAHSLEGMPEYKKVFIRAMYPGALKEDKTDAEASD